MKTTNIAALTLENSGKPVIDGQQMKEGKSFEKREGKWRPARPAKGLRKLHGLQGPIDDAFRDSFVVTGSLPEREKKLWAKWMRGDLRTGKASGQDHLVLFGDPVDPWQTSSSVVGRQHCCGLAEIFGVRAYGETDLSQSAQSQPLCGLKFAPLVR